MSNEVLVNAANNVLLRQIAHQTNSLISDHAYLFTLMLSVSTTI